MTDTNTPRHTGDELPQTVIDAIRQRHGPGEIAVPDRIDDAVLADANDYLKTLSKPRRAASRGWKWAAGTLTVASLATAVAMLVMLPTGEHRARPAHSLVADAVTAEVTTAETGLSSNVAVLRDDIDQNGRVDILDAFALARNLQRGDQTQAGWDQNNDGQVNQDDVDLVARNAVML